MQPTLHDSRKGFYHWSILDKQRKILVQNLEWLENPMCSIIFTQMDKDQNGKDDVH